MQGISWVAEDLLVFQEGLCSVQLVSAVFHTLLYRVFSPTFQRLPNLVQVDTSKSTQTTISANTCRKNLRSFSDSNTVQFLTCYIEHGSWLL